MEPPFYSEDDKGVIAERLEISVDEATDLLGSIESTVKLFLDLDAKDNTISNHTALELRTRVMTVVSTVTALERAIGEAETALDDLTPALDYLQGYARINRLTAEGNETISLLIVVVETDDVEAGRDESLGDCRAE